MNASHAQLVAITVALANSILAPPPKLTVSEWADKHRVLSAASGTAAPGQWRTSRTPYLKEIMDTIGGTKNRRVVFCKAARVGGSECGNNAIGYFIDQEPSAMLIAYPSDDAKKTWSKEVLDPLIEETPVLRAKVAPDGPRREKENTIGRKSFPGGYLGILSAGSSKQMRARTARVVIAEEVDDWDADVGEQGDPLSLLEVRTDTYQDLGKVYIVSTPTVADGSRIWKEWQDSDQRKYMVPCPHCGVTQELLWKNEKGQYCIVCEHDEHGHPMPRTARYQCQSCGELIDEQHKESMLARGEWVAQNPRNETAGFHISQLYSPFTTWAEVMRKFLKAKSLPDEMKVFDNTVRGVPFEDSTEKIDQHYLASRTDDYGEGVEVPHGVAVLTAGIDKQGDRIEYGIWGWGAEMESWYVAWGQIPVRPDDKPDPVTREPAWYAALDHALTREYRHASGAGVRVSVAGFDAGYDGEEVRRYCESRRGKVPVVSLLGRNVDKLIETPAEIAARRGPQIYKRSVEGPKHHIVGVDWAKDDLFARLKVTEPGPRYVHFSHKTEPVLFDQITAEKKVPRRIGFRIKHVWKKLEGRNNEYLDITVYARAALQLLGKATLDKLGEVATQLSGAKAQPQQKPGVVQQQPQRRNRGRGWGGVGRI